MPTEPQALRERLDAGLAGGWDFDRLLSLGARLPTRMDDVVLGWLEDSPSDEALDMTCAMLSGLWMAKATSPTIVTRLLTVSDALTLSTQTTYDLAVVMHKALNTALVGPERTMAAAALKALRASGDSDPTLRSLLQSLPPAPD